MGRYITGDFDYKFWFGVQPTDDILEFGSEYGSNTIKVIIYYSELKKIISKVKKYEKEFKKEFGITYKEFIKELNKKGDMSGEDKLKCRKASLIDLGRTIIKALKEIKSDLFIEAEY